MAQIDDSLIQYYMTGEGGVPPKEVPVRHDWIDVVQKEFEWQTTVGMNPDGVKLDDFEVRMFSWGIAGLQAIVLHKSTGLNTFSDVGLVLHYGAYSLVDDMIGRLAKV